MSLLFLCKRKIKEEEIEEIEEIEEEVEKEVEKAFDYSSLTVETLKHYPAIKPDFVTESDYGGKGFTFSLKIPQHLKAPLLTKKSTWDQFADKVKNKLCCCKR